MTSCLLLYKSITITTNNRLVNKTHSRTKLWFDRLLSKSLWRQFAILGIVFIGVFLISWLFLHISGCKWKDFCDNNDLSEWLLPLYLLIDSNVLSSLYTNSVNGWALFVSSIVYIVGLFIFNGMIISIMTNAIEQRIRNHNEGLIHYLQSGHYIIMGYDDMVPSIISHIFEKDADAFVLLMSSMETTSIREKLKRIFSEKQLERIIINYGHRTSRDYYKDIHLESSAEVFIVGMRSLPAHDAINVECVDSICYYLQQTEIKEHPKRITCVFEDLDTYAAFKTSEIFKEVRRLNIEFMPYNFYTGWAKQVFVKRQYKDSNTHEKAYNYPSVYGKDIIPDENHDNDKFVHLVFVGTTKFAVAFAMEAAHVLHFPNAGRVKTRITFIDKNADMEKNEFIIRNRHFFEIQPYWYHDFTHVDEKKKEEQGMRTEYIVFPKDVKTLDVEFEFIKGDVFSKEVQDEIAKWSNEHNERQYLSIFLALSNHRENFVMGMNMPDAIYEKAVPVFIRQDRSDNFVTNLSNADRKDESEKLCYWATDKDGKLVKKKRDARYANIYPFGMFETAFYADEQALRRAKLINFLYSTAKYETHKFQSIMVLDSMPEDKIWREADKYWQDLTVALKWSNLYNAYSIRTKMETLRAIRGLDMKDDRHDYHPLTEEEVKVMAIIEHNRWNVEKLLMGYRKARKEEDKYEHSESAGDLAKNKKLFIHHDIRPFDELDDVKEFDYEFSRYIPWIMKKTEAS